MSTPLEKFVSVIVSCVGELTIIGTSTPPNFTLVTVPRFIPVRIIGVPGVPFVALTAVITGGAKSASGEALVEPATELTVMTAFVTSTGTAGTTATICVVDTIV